MMSSAIPARLQFQCGHAAIVSLPRVKGETAAQRNDRIAREKSSALSRECDFCAPAIATAVNGNGHVEEAPRADEIPVVEQTPTVEEVILVAEAAPVLAIEDGPAEVEAVFVEEITSVEDPSREEAQPVAEVLTSVAEEAIAVAVTEAVNGEADAAPRAVRRRAQRKPRAEEVARGRRFLVEYRVERVLHAIDIHDALRQAATLGAAELTAITRED